MAAGGPNAGDEDVFLRKYDASGNVLWTRQLGTRRKELPSGVSADGLGSVYIAGVTEGNLEGPHAGGLMDAFIAKYDASGTLRWTQQWGTSEWDSIASLVADGQGNIYIAGVTGGNLWDFSAGWADAFLVKLRDSEPQVRLQAGDADQDFAFDQLDLVQVQITAK